MRCPKLQSFRYRRVYSGLMVFYRLHNNFPGGILHPGINFLFLISYLFFLRIGF